VQIIAQGTWAGKGVVELLDEHWDVHMGLAVEKSSFHSR
jgi:hypothetical protein